MAEAAKPRQVEIIRDGEHVHLVFTCASDYDAMLLYDRLGMELRSGCVRLEVEARERGTS